METTRRPMTLTAVALVGKYASYNPTGSKIHADLKCSTGRQARGHLLNETEAAEVAAHAADYTICQKCM